jgi:hypothetical protein
VYKGEHNIKMDVRGVVFEGMNWIELARVVSDGELF